MYTYIIAKETSVKKITFYHLSLHKKVFKSVTNICLTIYYVFQSQVFHVVNCVTDT